MEPVLVLATPESGRAGHRSVRIVPNLTKANIRTTLVTAHIAPTQKTLESQSPGPARKKSQNVPECPTGTDFPDNGPSASHPIRYARNFTITRKMMKYLVGVGAIALVVLVLAVYSCGLEAGSKSSQQEAAIQRIHVACDALKVQVAQGKRAGLTDWEVVESMLFGMRQSVPTKTMWEMRRDLLTVCGTDFGLWD